MLLEQKKEEDFFNQILKKAQQGGGEREPEESPKTQPKNVEDRWKGGKKLGNTNVEVKEEEKKEFTEKMPDEDFPQEGDSEENQMKKIMELIQKQHGGPKIEKEITATLVLYKNGFCVNDGPFLSFDHPENKKMMEDINSGQCPKQIRDMLGPAMSYAFSLDARSENYVPPKPKFQAFGGTGGRSLGSKTEKKRRN